MLRRREWFAVVAGLLLTLAFPRFGIAGLAWIAPGLMIAGVLGRSGGETFRLGYVAGLVHYLSKLSWLLLIPYRWHGVPIGPAAGWLALGAFLALFPATWIWLMAPVPEPKAYEKEGKRGETEVLPAPVATLEIPGWPLEGSGGVLARNWVRRAWWAFSGAAVWVALEMLLARIFGGFPWSLLGTSQYGMLPLIQVASVTGVYGVSFLVVWISLALLSAGLLVVRRPTSRSVWIGEIFLPFLVVAVLFNLGFRQLREEPAAAKSLRVTLIQPSIPQTLIWDSAGDQDRFSDLLRLSEQALSNRTDLLVWPEAAVPKMLRYDTNTFESITEMARRHQVWVMVGSDDAEPTGRAGEANYFNSSFLIAPDGRLTERYIKRNLVIFGEYVPWQKWLPFLKYLTPIEGGFTPGTGPVPFRLRSLGVTLAPLICFEDVFPHLVRGDVQSDTDVLVNLTNDGWFGEGAAQWQHATTAIFRAVENRVPLIRCANNGISCWIDAQGRLRDVLKDRRGTVHGPGSLTFDLPLAGRDPEHRPTFYTRHGDWFGWACVGASGIVLLRRIRRQQLNWRSSSPQNGTACEVAGDSPSIRPSGPAGSG